MRYLLFLSSLILAFSSLHSQYLTLDWGGIFGKPVITNGESTPKLAKDNYGNIYQVSENSGINYMVDYNPSLDEFDTLWLTTSESRLIYIQKFNLSGNLLWSRYIEGNISIRDFDVNKTTGELYFTGRIKDTLDIDPGPGEYLISSEVAFNLSLWNDILIFSLDSAGVFQWAHTFGTATNTGTEYGSSIAVDNDGDIYYAGRFYDDLDIDPNGTTIINAGSNAFGLFISKLDFNGNFIWAKGFPTGTGSVPYELATDAQNNVIVQALFTSPVNLDPGITDFTIGPTSGNGLVTMKFNQDGEFKWANMWHPGTGSLTPSHDFYDLKCDNNSNIYCTGLNAGSVNMDIDPGPDTLISGRGYFIQKFDSLGNLVWAISPENLSATQYNHNFARAIDIDDDGNILLAGQLKNDLDLNPGTGEYRVYGENTACCFDYVAFVSKFDSSGNFLWADHFGMGNKAVANSHQYATSIISTSNEGYWISGIGMGYFNMDPNSIVDSVNGQEICPNCIEEYSFFMGKYSYCDGSGSNQSVLSVLNDTISVSSLYNSYSWYSCDLNMVLPGMIDSILIPEISGNYSVIGSGGGCLDTSQCIQVIICPDLYVDVDNFINPSLNQSDGELSVQVINGQSPYLYYWPHNGLTDSAQTGLSSGIYEVQVTDGNNCSGGRFIPLYEVDTSIVNNPIIDTLISDTMDICVPFNFINYSVYDWHVNSSDSTELVVKWVFFDSTGLVFIVDVPYDISTISQLDDNIFIILNMNCENGSDNNILLPKFKTVN